MRTVLLDRIRNEVEVGVPRRFSIGTIFVLLTLYAMLFRSLVFVGTEATWTGIICLFFAAVTIGQMVLFRGARPRAASVIVGAILCPMMLIGLAFDELVTHWTGWHLLDRWLGAPGIFVSALLLLALLGLGLGYLVGGTLAGTFYVIGKLRPASGIAGVEREVVKVGATVGAGGGGEVGTEQTGSWARWLGQWVNPFQPRTPVRGALVTFLLTCVFGLLLAPFVMWMTAQQMTIVVLSLGVAFAIWTWNLQLWVYWPIALIAVGSLVSTWSVASLNQANVIATNFRSNSEVLLGFGHLVGGLVGLTVSAVVGWLQWIVCRHRERKSLHPTLLIPCALFVLGLGLLANNRVQAWLNSPMQQLLTKIADEGGYVSYAVFSIDGAVLKAPIGDAEFLQLRGQVAVPAYFHLCGKGFTDDSIAAMDGWHLAQLGLMDTSMSDHAFDDLPNFSTSNLFATGEMSDAFVTSLVSTAEMQRVLGTLAISSPNVTDAAISQLAVCGMLRSVSLDGCKITDQGITQLVKIKQLDILSLSGCPITDAGLQQLAKVVPKLQRLTIDNTSITDQGLIALAACKNLRFVSCKGTQVTAEGIAAFNKSRPACTVRWDEPEVP